MRYVPGPGVDQRVAMISASGVVHFYHADRLGNVIAMADSAGAVTDQYLYSPFGVEDVAAASGNPFRYTGRRYDPETGLYYYRARCYDPVLGRFLQTDPIGYADQMNLYGYVGNDPLNATDPTGMEREHCRECSPSEARQVEGPAVEGPGAGEVAASFVNSASKIVVGTFNSLKQDTYAGFGTPDVPAPQIGGVSPEVQQGTDVGLVAFSILATRGQSVRQLDDVSALTNRANEIHGALDPIAQSMRTTAVVSTREGGRFVASSRPTLSPAQRSVLNSGEVAARGLGHAEITAIRAAEAAGHTPRAIGVSRTICQSCIEEIVDRGIIY